MWPNWARRHSRIASGEVFELHAPPLGPGVGVGATTTGVGVRKTCVSDQGPSTGGANARACQNNWLPPGRSAGDGNTFSPGDSSICHTASLLAKLSLVATSMTYPVPIGDPACGALA